MNEQLKPDWIALDWGTSNLRAYAMQGATVIGRAQSNAGMGRLTRAEFEPTLRGLVGDWLGPSDMPVVACGMLGARQGWVEAPYRAVPCTPLSDILTRAPSSDGLNVHVISGLSQHAPPDVMRGEETQIAGFLSLNPGWDGVLCLPGTHTKWAQLSAGEVASFQTFMTGEIFALMSETSVLRHSVTSENWDDAAFDEAVGDAIAKPERLAARFFGLRAGDLLHSRASAESRAALSGYLIGAEIAAARPYWLGQNLAILGTGTQARAYQRALEAQGVPVLQSDTERATLAGLTVANRSLKGAI